MNEHNTIKEIIQSIYPISENSFSEIEPILEIEEFDKGETFIKKNKRNTKEYFVLEGICRSYLISPEGEEITVSFFTRHSVLSPFAIRTQDDLSILYFQALTDVTLASLPAEKFEELMVRNLEIRKFGNTVLRNELMLKVEKEIGLASLSAKERLIKFREKYPQLENLIPHTDIATYLGITNISLSRLRRDLIVIHSKI